MPVRRSTPSFRNIHFANITITNGKSYGIEILGLPEMPVENVTFDSIRIDGKGIHVVDARGIRLDSVVIATPARPAILLEDVAGFSLGRCAVAGEGEGDVVRIEGARSREILLPAVRFSAGPNVSPEAVRRHP
jgi:hypothetical protein